MLDRCSCKTTFTRFAMDFKLLIKFSAALGLIAVVSAGPKSEVGIDKMELVNAGPEKWFDFDVQMSKKEDATLVVKGKVEQFKDVPENMDVEIIISSSKENNGEYKEMMKMKYTTCEFMQYIYGEYIYPRFEKTAPTIPKPDTCPIPKNVYTIGETEFKMDDSASSFISPGNYRMEIRLVDGDNLQSGLTIFGFAKITE